MTITLRHAMSASLSALLTTLGANQLRAEWESTFYSQHSVLPLSGDRSTALLHRLRLITSEPLSLRNRTVCDLPCRTMPITPGNSTRCCRSCRRIGSRRLGARWPSVRLSQRHWRKGLLL